MRRDRGHGLSFWLSCTFSVFALLGGGSAAVAESPRDEAVERVFSDWSVTCEGAPRLCTLALTVAADDDRSWLGTIWLRPAVPGGATIIAQVPPGVHLASGFFAEVAGGYTELDYQKCSSRGCFARAELSEERLRDWKKAVKAEMRYRPSVTSPPVAFDISLMGITAALDFAGRNGQE